MRMRIVQSLLVCAGLLCAGVTNIEAQALREITFLPLPEGQQASVEQWQDSLCSHVESGQYAYVCIEANAIDMMYSNQYVLGNAALGNLTEGSGHLVPAHDLPSPCDDVLAFRELLRHTQKCIRAHNQKGKNQVQVVGLSYDDSPSIGFDSRVWHVAQYNQAGLADSLMTFLADEESDTNQLARLTFSKLENHRENLEKSLGRLDYFVWRQFFLRCMSREEKDVHQMQCEDFHLFDRTFKGRKLVIGCSDLKHFMLSDENK